MPFIEYYCERSAKCCRFSHRKNSDDRLGITTGELNCFLGKHKDVINLKKYVFDRYCLSHRSFLCFPIAAACTPSLPFSLFTISCFFRWKPSPYKPSSPFSASTHVYLPFFSRSYNLIYYFAKRHVSFSSATITMYVVMLSERVSHQRIYDKIFSTLLHCIFYLS